ncbi:MAG: right-handed parallel beta-helix repeat-containing protein [Actinomycetota bacterium]
MGLLVASIIQGAPASHAASIWIVDDGPATCAGVDFASIQDAVDHAAVAAGDWIRVCPGNYPETVSVTKELRIEGPQAGVDARTRPGGATTEATVGTTGGAFNVKVGGVTIDGFTIRGGTDPGWGVRFDPDASGYAFVNNIVEDNGFGLYLNSDGASPTLVRRNLFKNNDRDILPAGDDDRDGNGIYSDLGLTDVEIDRNKFIGHPSNAIFLAGGAFDSTTSQLEVTISNNRLESDNSIALINTQSALIIDNVHTGSLGSAVYIGGGVQGLDIVGNVYRDGNGKGIRIAASQLREPDPNGDIRVYDNEFVRNAQAAVDVEARDRYSGILDARYNWWGHRSGPSRWGNGAGQAVSAHVNFFPWALNTDFERMAKCRNRSTRGSDIVDGTTRNDILCGGRGDDIIRGRGGNDLLIGGSGDDLIKGGGGNDALIGGVGFDLLSGGAGFDSLQGWQDDDLCLNGADGGQAATCEN